VSDALSIAAVTMTLRNLVHAAANEALPGTVVTTKPLDRARDGITGNQLNVFLYLTSINGTLRNQDPPGMRPGENGHPALPLNLGYLITAFGDDLDDALGHRLLGHAMRALHDRPLLSAADLQAALPASDLHRQVERVRVTFEPMTSDEQSRLWTAFQTQYRISAAYRVAVILIESRRPHRAAAPVLARGEGDTGPEALPSLTSPLPTLEQVAPPPIGPQEPRPRPYALPGDRLVVSGHNLDGDQVEVSFEHPALDQPVTTGPVPGSAGPDELSVDLPAAVPAGFASVGVTTEVQQVRHDSNRLPLPVAPTITTPMPLQATRGPDGRVQLQVGVAPALREGQRALMIAGGHVAAAAPFTAPASALDFELAIDPGEYLLRVRVDGIDTPAVDLTSRPPSFDPAQRLVVT
jgi:Pvc16 N-terminal domain